MSSINTKKILDIDNSNTISNQAQIKCLKEILEKPSKERTESDLKELN